MKYIKDYNYKLSYFTERGATDMNDEGEETDTDTDTDNFFFQPSFDLGEGVHTVTAVAWAKDFSSNSKHSQEYVFFIEALPAPTLLIPNEEDVVSKLKPRILGLSKSATLIHFYIDGVYNCSSSHKYIYYSNWIILGCGPILTWENKLVFVEVAQTRKKSLLANSKAML